MPIDDFVGFESQLVALIEGALVKLILISFKSGVKPSTVSLICEVIGPSLLVDGGLTDLTYSYPILRVLVLLEANAPILHVGFGLLLCDNPLH